MPVQTVNRTRAAARVRGARPIMFERSMRGYTDAAHDVALHPASEVLARAYSHAVSACTYKGQDPDAVAYALGYCEHTLMMLKETGRYDRTAVKGS